MARATSLFRNFRNGLRTYWDAGALSPFPIAATVRNYRAAWLSALFLPVVSRVAVRSGIPAARLLIPVGFCVILGGTITLVGSSPLILLNELVRHTNALLFKNAGPGRHNMVYRRGDGSIGWVEPRQA